MEILEIIEHEKRHCQRCVRRRYASLGTERIGLRARILKSLRILKTVTLSQFFQDRDFQHKRCYLRRPDAFVVAQ